MGEIRTVEIGGHTFRFQFWRDIETSENPPVFKCSAIVDVALTFDIHVVAGAARDPSAKDRFLGSYQRASAAETVREVKDEALGLSFSGLRFEGLKEFGPESCREVYLGAAGDDLFVFSYTINRATNPHEDEWRMHLLTLVAATMTEAQPSA